MIYSIFEAALVIFCIIFAYQYGKFVGAQEMIHEVIHFVGKAKFQKLVIDKINKMKEGLI